MKPIDLHHFLEVIGQDPSLYPNPIITNTTINLNRLRENTIVFHLTKTDELNVKRLKSLNHCYIVTDQPLLKQQELPHKKFIFVSNLPATYDKWIRFYRGQFNIPVVAVTGTCGKTTTKEMIKQILAQEHKVVGTIRSKNNLRFNHDYLMEIDETTEMGVFEAAMTHPGNLITESVYFKPSIGIITTIGIDHLNHMKTLDNYIRAKGEMLAALNYKGTLIINYDSERIRSIDLTPFKGKVITYGLHQRAQYQASNIQFEQIGMKFTLNHERKTYEVYVPGLGNHQVSNALAAIAAVHQLGMPIEKAITYLSLFKPVRSHVELYTGIHQSTLIDDTWSSNPTSLKAALEVLVEKGKRKKKILVLGRIAYLGDHTEKYYDHIARLCIDYGVDTLITTDEPSKIIGNKALLYGFKPYQVINCMNKQELLSVLEKHLDEQTIVLFKLSMLEKSYQDVIESLKLKPTP